MSSSLSSSSPPLSTPSSSSTSPSLSSTSPTSPPPTLDVVVVGAGIGGLLAAIGLRLDGHRVVVADQAAAFGEVGAGLRLPPNSTRILRRWGVDVTYLKKTHSNGNRFLRHDTGEVLVDLPHGDGLPELAYGGSYLMVHRADYHAALLARARALGVDVRAAHRAVGYDWAAPAVDVEGHASLKGDLVVVADGVQSAARAAFAGRATPPADTGDLSYRLLVPGHVLLADADAGVRELVSLPWVSSWCGPGAHVIGYPVRGGEVYNVVFCVAAATMPAAAAADATAAKTILTDNSALVARFAAWEPRVRRLAALAGAPGARVLQWRLFDLARADRWAHPGGRAVLLGDAAHPMLPYMASGAAMACEDAAVLRGVLKEALQDVRGGDDLPLALTKATARYQALRQPRTAVLQRWGRRLQHAYHLADGPAQAARDAAMAAEGAGNPLFWGSAARSRWLFGLDAEDLGGVAANAREAGEKGIDVEDI